MAGLIGAGLLVAPATAGSASAATCSWQVHTAPVPAGYDTASAQGARDRAFVGGGRGPDGYTHPLLWRGNSVTVLPSPADANTSARDVNDRGVVVGNAYDTKLSPLMWVAGKAVPLARPAGASDVGTGAINDAGTIVGYAIIGDVYHGIAWSTRTPKQYTDLGVGQGNLVLNLVTESGTIYGQTFADEYGTQHAVKGTLSGGFSALPGLETEPISVAWAEAGPYLLGLGTPAGTTTEETFLWDGATFTSVPFESGGAAVNSSGVAVGFGGETHGEVWDDGDLTPLPSLVPGGFTKPTAISEDGRIVGSSTPPDGDFDASVPVSWTCS